MSSVATPVRTRDPHAGPAPSETETLTLAQRRRGVGDAVLALAIGIVLAAVSFIADGGLRLAPVTTGEIGLILGCSAIVALALAGFGTGREQPLHGAWTLAGLAALTALSALSIGWSLAPSESWLDASRMLSYLCVLAAAIALVRLLPGRSAAVLGGVALASAIVCGYAMATKVAPGALAPDEQFARLREPFGYWNGIGLMAALGVPPLLWLAARRAGHAALNALAYPGLALVFTTLMLSFSRGALVALAIGLAVWFATIPLRLRGAAALLGGAFGAALITLWAFTQDALTTDRVPLDSRESVGAELGVLLAVVLVALFVAGLTAHFVAAQSPPSQRTRWVAGRTILGGLACIPVAGLIALAAAPGGIDGQISDGWESLTAKETREPPNSPARLTETASVRSRYWREAIDIWREHELTGAGAGSFALARLHFRSGNLRVRHAHGYVVQTLADLGLIGLLLSLATLAAFLAAASRAAGLRGCFGTLRVRLARGRSCQARTQEAPPGSARQADEDAAWRELTPARRARRVPKQPLSVRRNVARRTPYGPERIALLTLFSIVVVFGVHATIDWTWHIPGTAVTALLCAGWLAGRGPLFGGASARVVGPARPRALPPADWPRVAGAAAVVVIALAASWSVLQPLRSVHAADDALTALDRGKLDVAHDKAVQATEINPLAVEPVIDLAALEAARGDLRATERTLRRAVALQPANPTPWRQLGRFQMDQLRKPREALSALRAAYYLDPRSPQAVSDFLEVSKLLQNESRTPPPSNATPEAP